MQFVAFQYIYSPLGATVSSWTPHIPSPVISLHLHLHFTSLLTLLPWRWTQQIPPKHRHLLTRVQDVTSQKAVTCFGTADNRLSRRAVMWHALLKSTALSTNLYGTLRSTAVCRRILRCYTLLRALTFCLQCSRVMSHSSARCVFWNNKICSVCILCCNCAEGGKRL
jgi:hypothetical protein